MEKCSEMKYVSPDGEAYIRTIQKETKNFNEAADFEGAHQAFVAILNANSHFNTTRVIASIRNSQDTNDEFYRKEMEYIFEIEPQIDVEMKKFYESYLKSPYRTAVSYTHLDVYKRQEQYGTLEDELNEKYTEQTKLLENRESERYPASSITLYAKWDKIWD